MKYYVVLFKSNDEYYGNVPCFVSESFDKAYEHAMYQNLRTYVEKNKSSEKLLSTYVVHGVDMYEFKNPSLCLCEYDGTTLDEIKECERLLYDTFNDYEYRTLRNQVLSSLNNNTPI